MYTREQIRTAVLDKGYVYFDDKANKGFDVNIVGARNSSTGNKVTNLFDDLLTLSYKDENGIWKYHEWVITTDAGTKGVKEFHNPKGVARLIPNQYRATYAVDLHQGKYEALCQRLKKVNVWRDRNKNMTFDNAVVDTADGINIHCSNFKTESQFVENWSEGCQVFKRKKDFDAFMLIINKAKAIHGNSFTYTLLESIDIK